ncbi:MAG: hypothetical protein NVS3B20_14550 [Polyangiales bacterium]
MPPTSDEPHTLHPAVQSAALPQGFPHVPPVSGLQPKEPHASVALPHWRKAHADNVVELPPHEQLNFWQ